MDPYSRLRKRFSSADGPSSNDSPSPEKMNHSLRAGSSFRLPNSIRGMHFLLFIVILMPILLTQGWIYYRWYRDQRTDEYRGNAEVARGVATTLEGFVQDVLHQELTVGEALSSTSHYDSAQITRLLVDSNREFPSVRYYFWASPEGTILASSGPSGAGVNISDRPYFQEILRGRKWVVSDLFPEGRVVGGPAFTIARAFYDYRGDLRGIVVASVEPTMLSTVLRPQRTEGGTITIIDHSGTLVYSYPETQIEWPDRAITAGNPAVIQALAERTDVWARNETAYPIPQISAYVSASDLGWVVGASRPMSVAMAPIYQAIMDDFGLLLLVTIAMVFVALRVAKGITGPLHLLEKHALAIGEGTLDRSIDIQHPAELAALGQAFNVMAEEVRTREEQLARAQRLEAAANMAGQVAHEFNNLLGPLVAYPELLRKRYPYDLSLARYCEAMRSAALEMAAINEDMLALGHHGILDLQPIDLNDLVNVAIGLLNDESGAITLQTQLEQRLKPIQGSSEMIARVIVHLLNNAIEATDHHGTIVVRTENVCVDGCTGRYNRVEEGEYVRLTVTDRGKGIPREIRHKIFDSFFSTRTGLKHRGSGLGLSVVDAIVKDHNGYVDLETEEGMGSSFSIYLPTLHKTGPQNSLVPLPRVASLKELGVESGLSMPSAEKDLSCPASPQFSPPTTKS